MVSPTLVSDRFFIPVMMNPISPELNFIDYLESIPEVRNIERIISKFGIVRTTKDFDGLYFKGLDKNYDFSRIKKYVIKGNIPLFSDNFSNDSDVVSALVSISLNFS